MLTCARCKTDKPADLEHFPAARRNTGRQGYASWCRECYAEYRSITKNNRYAGSISREDLETLQRITKHCAICLSEGKLVIDHDHINHQVRGMLCNHCNLGIGHFRDNPDLLEIAASYIRTNNNRALWAHRKE